MMHAFAANTTVVTKCGCETGRLLARKQARSRGDAKTPA